VPELPTNWRNLDPVPEDRQPHIPENWTPSQSFLRIMDKCDRAAYLRLRFGDAGSHELNRGAIAHMVFERLERMIAAPTPENEKPDWLVSAQERHEQAAIQVPPEIGREVLYEVMRENPELQVCAEERDALRYMVDHFCRGMTFADPIIGIETTLTLEINGFRVLIRPDLLEEPDSRTLRIRDHKTAWPPDAEEFRRQAFDANDNPRWAGNYQLNMAAVVAAFGVADDGAPLGNYQRYELVLDFPRVLYPDGIAERTVVVDRLQVHSFRDDLELQLDRLRDVCLAERKWQPTPGSHCRNECPASDACPLPPILRPESQLADLDSLADLEQLAANVNFMGERGTALKKRLKSAALRLEEENPGVLDLGNGDRGVRIGRDLAFVFIPKEGEEIKDKAKLLEAGEAAEHGVPFIRSDHVRATEGIEFAKRKTALPPRAVELEPEQRWENPPNREEKYD